MNVLRQEQLRHQYLEAIGISSWLPRTQLPAAAPSPQWVEDFTWTGPDEYLDEAFEAPDEVAEMPVRGPETARVASPAAASAASSSARAAAQARLAELTDAPPQQPTAPPAVKPVTERSAERSAARPVAGSASTPVPTHKRQSAPRVKLAFILAGDLLIVDSLPPAGRQGFGPAHQRLLSGIARALGVQTPPSDASLLPWPPFAGATLNQGAEELSRAVERKLKHTLTLRPVSRALLLGEAAAQWLLGREEALDALRGIRFNLQAGIPCVASVSLSQALQLPEVKAEIWRDIQPLVTIS